MKQLLMITAFLCLITGAQAQYFQHLYGMNSDVYFFDGHRTTSGHFIVGHTSGILYAVHTNSSGNVPGGFFNKKYDISDPAGPNAVNSITAKSVQLSQGGYAIAGSGSAMGSAGAGGFGFYVTTLASSGIPVGVTGYVTSNITIAANPEVRGIIQSSQNNQHLYVCGLLNDKTFVMKVDLSGTILWSAVYDLDITDNNNFSHPRDLLEASFLTRGTRELLVVGGCTGNGVGSAYILKVDFSTGIPTSPVLLYGSPDMSEEFTSIISSSNPNISCAGEGFVLSGIVHAGNADYWLLAVDNAGTVKWSTIFDEGDDLAWEVIERFVGPSTYEYYLVGETHPGVFGNFDIMVIKADATGSGVPSGQFMYSNQYENRAYRISQITGGGAGISMYGYSTEPNAFSSNRALLIIKSYFNGVTACDYDIDDPDPSLGPPYAGFHIAEIIDDLTDFSLDIQLLTDGMDDEICFEQTIGEGDNGMRLPAGTGDKKDQETIKSELKLLPNPLQGATQELTLELSEEQKGTPEVQVTDMLGRVYYTGRPRRINGKEFKIRTNGMSPGTYLVQFKTGNTVLKKILVIQ